MRFIALHIIKVKIKPEAPTRHPETTRTVLLIANKHTKGEVSPSLQPLRVFRYPLCGGHPRNAPEIGKNCFAIFFIVNVNPAQKLRFYLSICIWSYKT